MFNTKCLVNPLIDLYTVSKNSETDQVITVRGPAKSPSYNRTKILVGVVGLDRDMSGFGLLRYTLDTLTS